MVLEVTKFFSGFTHLSLCANTNIALCSTLDELMVEMGKRESVRN